MKKTPNIISTILKDLGLNHSERIDIPDREVYVLSSIDDDGFCIPTGLPCLYEITKDGARRIEEKESFEILEKNGKYKFCKYYKEEEKSPYEYGTPENSFWFFERMYWELECNSPSLHNEFEDEARTYIKENRDKENFMTSDAPIEQKGFVMFAEEMLRKWMPYEVDMIFKY